MIFVDEEEIDDFDIKLLNQHTDASRCICGDKYIITEYNGIKRYVCDKCGIFINTQEDFNITEDTTIEYEEKRVKYGNKSGESYIRKMKDDIIRIMGVVINAYNLSDEIVNNTLNIYLDMRAKIILRGKPRRGFIAAILHSTVNIPSKSLSQLFGIDSKYISSGIKMYKRELKPYFKRSLKELVTNEFGYIMPSLPPEFSKEYGSIIIDFCIICYSYYIGINTTIRTKCLGIIKYIIEAKVLTMPLTTQKFLSSCDTTINKFYDLLIIYLFAIKPKDQEATIGFTNRREQLRDFLNHHDIPLIQIQLRGRFKKALQSYEF